MQTAGRAGNMQVAGRAGNMQVAGRASHMQTNCRVADYACTNVLAAFPVNRE